MSRSKSRRLAGRIENYCGLFATTPGLNESVRRFCPQRLMAMAVGKTKKAGPVFHRTGLPIKLQSAAPGQCAPKLPQETSSAPERRASSPPRSRRSGRSLCVVALRFPRSHTLHSPDRRCPRNGHRATFRRRVLVDTAASAQPHARLQHLPRPMAILEMSKPCGTMLIDCLQADEVSCIAAVKRAPSICRLKPLLVTLPDTAPV